MYEYKVNKCKSKQLNDSSLPVTGLQLLWDQSRRILAGPRIKVCGGRKYSKIH
jgi:hypothetical protein